jgi:ribonuclease P protein component
MRELPATARLSEPQQFAGVFNAPQIRVSTRAFLVLAIPSPAPQSRIGIVVAKKNIRKATRRNRLKRIIREHFRLSPLCNALDLVVLARGPADELPNPMVWKELEKLWRAINQEAIAS